MATSLNGGLPVDQVHWQGARKQEVKLTTCLLAGDYFYWSITTSCLSIQ